MPLLCCAIGTAEYNNVGTTPSPALLAEHDDIDERYAPIRHAATSYARAVAADDYDAVERDVRGYVSALLLVYCCHYICALNVAITMAY